MRDGAVSEKRQNLRKQSEAAEKKRGLVYAAGLFSKNAQNLLHLTIYNI